MGIATKLKTGSTTHLIASSAYGTCSTTAATVAKTVTLSNFDTFIAGMTIHVRFTYSNTAASPTLNVNSKGAKPIYAYGTTVPGTTVDTSWQAGAIVSFTYNTENNSNGCWVMNDYIANTTNTVTVPTITLNGTTTTTPSFYAPTGAGTSGQYLKSSGSGAPTWANFPTVPTITLNGSSSTSPSFYAPTGAGTSGQFLKSNGSGAPTWTTGNTIEYIIGTQTASTNAWTGVTADAALYDGKMILYVLPYAGTSTGATLNLTLSGGSTSGAKSIYRYGNTTAITTHYGAGSRIFLIYDGTNQRWNSSAWYYSNTNTLLRTYKATNNIELPILLRNSAASQTAANAAITTYADSYGAIAETNSPTINPSTGLLIAGGGISTTSINGINIENSGVNIFIAEYDNTTYNDILEAYNNGKTIICTYDDLSALLEKYESNTFTFSHTNDTNTEYLTIDENSLWDYWSSPIISTSTSTSKIYTASCTTGATTTAKVATLDDSTGFSLTAGVMVAVRFTYGNSATTPTLNVSSTGAKTIAIPSSTTAFTTGNGTTYNTWGARETILFTYTGTYWVHAPSGYLGYLTYNKADSVPTLDSGTWTPTFNTTAAISSYSAQNGWYSRVGNVITGGFYVSAATNSGYTSTAIQINGFPFTPQYTSFFGGVAANVYTAANTIFHSWNISTAGAITGRAQPCNKTSAGALSVTTGIYYPASSTITLSGTFSIVVSS